MTKRTIRSVKGGCDRLWSQLVRALAGHRCERCGGPATEAHHTYGRTNHRLRWEPRNGVAFCYRCHLWAETEPLSFADWLRQVRSTDAAFLEAEHCKGTVRRTLDDYLALEVELRMALARVPLEGEAA